MALVTNYTINTKCFSKKHPVNAMPPYLFVIYNKYIDLILGSCGRDFRDCFKFINNFCRGKVVEPVYVK